MKKYALWGIAALAAILSCGACSRPESAPAEATDPSAELFEKIRHIDRLTLARMTVEKTATIDDLSFSEAKGAKKKAEAIIDALKIGDRVAVYSYDTYLEGYIDLSSLRPEDIGVDTVSHTATLRLPAIRTRLAGRDPEIHEVHYRVTGLRSNIGAKERADLKERMNTAVKRELSDSNAYSQRVELSARRSAERYFTGLLKDLGYTAIISFARP